MRKTSTLPTRLSIGFSAALALVLAFGSETLLGGTPGFGPTNGLFLTVGILGVAVSLGPERLVGRLPASSAYVGVTMLSTVVALTLTEVVLRVCCAADFTNIYQADPRYLHSLIPGGVKNYVHAPINGGGRIRVEINSDGFRGDQLAFPTDAFRVFVYGDSFIEAEFTETADTFVKRLETKLAATRNRPVVVVNAGVVGYGPGQALLRMRDELPRYQPDLVILTVFADNDFGDLIRNRLFRLADDGTLVENRPRLARDIQWALDVATRKPVLTKMVNRAIWNWRNRDNPVTRGAPVGFIESVREEQSAEFERYESQPRIVTNLFNDLYDADVSTAPESPSTVYKVELFQAVLEEIARLGRVEGRRFMLLIVPSPVDVVDGYMITVERARYPAYRPEHLTDFVARAAEAVGVEHLDLFSLYEGTDDGFYFFRGGNNHWNDAGQEAAAEATADFIQVNDLLPVR